MFTSIICNEPNTVETDIPPIMLDDGHWTSIAVLTKNFNIRLRRTHEQHEQLRQKSDRYSTAVLKRGNKKS